MEIHSKPMHILDFFNFLIRDIFLLIVFEKYVILNYQFTTINNSLK
jgi:hypothetical protein